MDEEEDYDVKEIVVQPGDTLVKISVREGISVNTLKKVNRLWSEKEIYPGKVLIIRAPIHKAIEHIAMMTGLF